MTGELLSFFESEYEKTKWPYFSLTKIMLKFGDVQGC